MRFKKILTLVVTLGIVSGVFGQADFGIEKKKPCYEKNSGNQVGKYVDWQCGKLAGVIDCNEELEFDEGTNTVLKRAKDQVNIQGVGKPFSGTCETCHMNGNLQRRVTFVNGKENGIDTTYYESGCPQVVRSHIQGEESGTWTFFFDSTENIAWEMNYYLGEKDGRQIYMKANGDTSKIEHYKNGLLDGLKQSFYKDSKLYKEANYSRGVLNGKFKTYNTQGVLIEELNYLGGKKDQECKYYYDDGVLLKTENWKEGVKNGEFKMFYYQGHVQTLETYKNGIKNGRFEEYYPDQSPKTIAVYEKDELLEEHRYDEQGNETYSFGAPTSTKNEDDEMPGKKKKR